MDGSFAVRPLIAVGGQYTIIEEWANVVGTPRVPTAFLAEEISPVDASGPLDWLFELFSGNGPGFFATYGRWILIGGGVLVLLLILVLLLRLGRRRKSAERTGPNLEEDLADYPPAPGQPGPQRLMIQGQPVRVRLVVVAPAGKQTNVNQEGVAGFLDQMLHGLGAVIQHDKPRVRVWPPQLSNRGFAPTFHRLVSKPDPEGRPSHWVLVAGQAKVGTWSVLLGMALWAEKENLLGRLNLEPNQWQETLRIRDP